MCDAIRINGDPFKDIYVTSKLVVIDRGRKPALPTLPDQRLGTRHDVEISSVDDIDCKELISFLMGAQCPEPLVEWVRLGGDWVVVKWSDGTVTKLQPQDGDEYDPLVGLLAMAFRKVGRNRLRYAKFDGVVDSIAKGDFTSDDLRYLADTLHAVADGMDCEGFDRDYRPAQTTKED